MALLKDSEHNYQASDTTRQAESFHKAVTSGGLPFARVKLYRKRAAGLSYFLKHKVPLRLKKA